MVFFICLLFFEDGWDSNEINGDLLEFWELVIVGVDVLFCGFSGFWGIRFVFRGDVWGIMLFCELEVKMVFKLIFIGFFLEFCN